MAQTDWILTSDRLPDAEEEGSVLCLITMQYQNEPPKVIPSTFSYNHTFSKFFWYGEETITEQEGYKVLAWQPLPEPYDASAALIESNRKELSCGATVEIVGMDGETYNNLGGVISSMQETTAHVHVFGGDVRFPLLTIPLQNLRGMPREEVYARAMKERLLKAIG